MDENLYVAARKVCRYPPEPFCYPEVNDYRYFPTVRDLEYYHCRCYRQWFCNEIINNRFLMFNVLSEKSPTLFHYSRRLLIVMNSLTM